VADNTTLGTFERTDAAGTFRWCPDGRPCVACGDRVEGLWRDDDGLRCADCKSWT